MADLDTSNPGDRDAIAAGLRDVFGGMSGHAICIAAADATDREKRAAYAVCTGTNDQDLINDVIANLRSVPPFTRNSETVTTGKTGNIQLSNGLFMFNGIAEIPVGSAITINGAGCSRFSPVDADLSAWRGGTVIYNQSTTPKMLRLPKSPGNYPRTSFNSQGIDWVARNPSTGYADAVLDLDGMQSGVVGNSNVLADLSVNTAGMINLGLRCSASGFSSRKRFHDMNSCNFRSGAFEFNATHVMADHLCGVINGSLTQRAAFRISSLDDNIFMALQGFTGDYAVRVTGGNKPLHIYGLHAESVGEPIYNPTSNKVYLYDVDIDNTVPFSGDIADPVKTILRGVWTKSSPTKVSDASGTATIPTGQTSIAVTFDMVANPTRKTIVPKAVGGASFYVTSESATGFTINVPTAVAADTAFFWAAAM